MVNFPRFVVPLSIVGTTIGGMVIFKDYLGGTRMPQDIKLLGRTAIVTGANSGIGKEVAHNLAERGGRVIMACRNLEKCEEVCKQIKKETYNLNVYCKELDLSSLESVHKFAEDIIKNENRLDILVNNAGVMGINPKEITTDGVEMHLGVNFLGHFLLTNLLLDKLKTNTPSRIINTGSLLFKRGCLNFADLNSEVHYKWENAYNQSKLANVLFTQELSKRLHGTGVSTFCVLPVITNTNISRNLKYKQSVISKYILSPFYWLILKSPIQGAQGTIYCAVEPSLEKFSGQLFTDCQQVPEMDEISKNIDTKNALRLWLTAEKWTKLNTY